MKICKVENCNYKYKSKGYCGKHWQRVKRHGDPNYINPKSNRDGQAKKRNYARTAKWKRDNKEYYHAYIEARRQKTKLATPYWADLKSIENFYRNRPIGHHVDHIIPLNGKIVSGLRILENLQYLPIIENLKKGRKT